MELDLISKNGKGRLKPSLLFFDNSFVIAILVIAASVFVLSQLSTRAQSESESRAVLMPVEFLKRTSFGYDLVLADSLWLNIIQKYEFCENSGEKSYNPEVGVDQVLTATLKPSRCHKGWVYRAIDTMTELDPRFQKGYEVGSLMLSVGVDDREGARLIFEKGVARFPERWQLAYAAAYHYLFEIQDAERAADLLLQASQHGGPSWLPNLAARLYSKSGRKTLGISVLVEFLKTNPTEATRKKAIQRLQELKALPEDSK